MHQTHASSAYGESSVIWVKDSDSVRDRVKVRVISVVLVTARVRFRDVTRHRRTRCRRTHQTHFTRTHYGGHVGSFSSIGIAATNKHYRHSSPD